MPQQAPTISHILPYQTNINAIMIAHANTDSQSKTLSIKQNTNNITTSPQKISPTNTDSLLVLAENIQKQQTTLVCLISAQG